MLTNYHSGIAKKNFVARNVNEVRTTRVSSERIHRQSNKLTSSSSQAIFLCIIDLMKAFDSHENRNILCKRRMNVQIITAPKELNRKK